MITFTDDQGIVGIVRIADDKLISDDVPVYDIVRSWRGTPEEFQAYYDGWGNGYLRARRSADEEIMP